ncbi:unnamed protein product [Symbiodinium sp. CCMP2592]|nr:unnamed protein product [Symbiodinium sp. CCMP2592]
MSQAFSSCNLPTTFRQDRRLTISMAARTMSWRRSRPLGSRKPSLCFAGIPSAGRWPWPSFVLCQPKASLPGALGSLIPFQDGQHNLLQKRSGGCKV